MDNLLGIFLLVVGLLIGLMFFVIFAAASSSAEKDKKFMADCMKDHKEYECTALLNQSNCSTAPLLIPMPMVVSK